MKIGIIGAGAWGKNYLRTFPKVAQELSVPIETIIGTRHNWKYLADFQLCDAFVIATPPDSHIEIAEYLLQRNFPIMVEKPLALSHQEAAKLLPYSPAILVNHQHLFSNAFEYLNSHLQLSNILSIFSQGTGWGPFRDYSPIFDYGPHDVSFGLAFWKKSPKVIEARSFQATQGSNTKLVLDYEGIKHYCVLGNGFAEKRRELEVHTTQGKYVYDGLHHTLHCNNQEIPLPSTLPLHNSCLAFIQQVQESKYDVRFDFSLQLRLLKTLEEIQKIRS